jgi:ribosome assembly protein 1
MIVGELIKQEIMDSGEDHAQVDFEAELEKWEEQYMFSPEKGNVAFSSAYDCWSFTLPSFAPKVASKLGMNPKALCKYLWGEYFFD